MSKNQYTDNKLVILNSSTGEIVGDYCIKNRVRSHYFLIFHNMIAKAGISLSPLAIAMIGAMNTRNRLELNQRVIAGIARNYNSTQAAVKMTITRLAKSGALIRELPSLYFVNPYYFAKASLTKVNQLRNEYAQMLFSRKSKTVTPKQKEKIRVKALEKQIEAIISQ